MRIFYRQRDTVTPKEKTHMSELAEEYNFTYMHTPIYLEESVQLMLQDDSRHEEDSSFLGDGIYPNPEYDQATAGADQRQNIRNWNINTSLHAPILCTSYIMLYVRQTRLQAFWYPLGSPNPSPRTAF